MNGMYVFSRRLLLGALTLLLLTTACNFPAATPAPMGTILPTGQVTSSPLPAATATLGMETPTALIPVTGMGDVTLQCQFCVNDEPHAVLIIPELVSYNVADPLTRITCLTAQVVNGRRILLCRGAPQTSFNLNVCADDVNCLQFPITLQTCPLAPQTGIVRTQTPVVLAPINTLPPTLPVDTATAVPTQAVIVATPTVAVTVTAPPPAPTQPVSSPPATATAAQLQPTRVGRVPQQPGTGIQDPGEFVRWYFGAVWQFRNYQELWDNYLTPSFKAHVSSGSYQEYVTWWSSVDRVVVNSVHVIENDGTHAWVRVNVTFHIKDGRVISNQQYDYDLLYDAARQTWMFDFRTRT